jgi:two-component system NtrC family sensor kinase
MNHSDQLGFESKRRSDGAGGARPQILVLDDDKTLAWMLFELLRLMGYEATVFTSPQEALTSINCRRFDAIICDFHMPQMNGREFYRQVAARRPEQARHIVFLTGDMSDDGTLEFLESNSNPHLFKPFQMGDLQNLLNHCVARDFERIIANAA